VSLDTDAVVDLSNSQGPSSVLLPFKDLLLLVPSLYLFVSKNIRCVLHVDVSVGFDLAVLASVSQCGVGIVSSVGGNVAAFAMLAHAASTTFSVPFIHLYHSETKSELGTIPESIYAFFESRLSGEHVTQTLSVSALQLLVEELELSKGCPLVTCTGNVKAKTMVASVGLNTTNLLALTKSTKTKLLNVHLYRPWPLDLIAPYLSQLSTLVVLDRTAASSPWTPLFLDFAATAHAASGSLSLVSCKVGSASPSTGAVSKLKTLIESGSIKSGTVLEDNTSDIDMDTSSSGRKPVAGELAYLTALKHIYGNRLEVVNATEHEGSVGTLNYHYGALLDKLRKNKVFQDHVSKVVVNEETSPALRDQLRGWLARAKNVDLKTIVSLLQQETNEDAQLLYSQAEYFERKSYWLISNERWATDIANSGIHNIIASKEDINLLIIDCENFSKTFGQARGRTKKDIGLYAMNYGTCYVASIAVHSSYTQTFQALQEADKHAGVSVVLAFAPFDESMEELNDYQQAMACLVETKTSVDAGYWPLYRWDPCKETAERFILDSDKIKASLQEFLSRQQHLSQFIRDSDSGNSSSNVIPGASSKSFENVLATAHATKHSSIVESYLQLQARLKGTGESVVILFGSDGGNAEGLAQRLFHTATTSLGFKARCLPMNEFPVDDLLTEKNIIFVVSTAGQGEFPVNAKDFWKDFAVKDLNLETLHFAVFTLGDRNYWPREEDKIFFCKPGKDLDARLGILGGNRLVECGIGDDQDSDGFLTGWEDWQPKLWTSLGVGSFTAEKKTVKGDEQIKRESRFLRGTLALTIEDKSTGAIPYEDTKIIKFHGIYMQDDRDLRQERQKQGIEKAFSFMIRIRAAGGVLSPKQWLALDEVADLFANGTIKITTRQAVQFHAVLKHNLKPLVRHITQVCMDSISACGDVNRNVMLNANPMQTKVHPTLHKLAIDLTTHLTPETNAYYEIWLDKKQVGGDPLQDFVEPIYGDVYLPRKFKIGIAIPPENDVDIYTQDIGFIAILNAAGDLDGFDVLIGGGMGSTHNNTKTYPCLGQLMAFCTLDQAIQVAEKILLVQRDYGDRTNRKHARMKYTVVDHGIPWFKDQVEQRLGYKLQEPKAHVPFVDNIDVYDWVQGIDGLFYKTLFIEHGRVKDTPSYQMRAGLKELAQVHTGDFRFTGNQNLMIGKVEPSKKAEIDALLAKWNIDNNRHSAIRKSSIACVALPTCGLALAESERYLPRLITLIEQIADKYGVKEAITIRSSGCPNGCSRPFASEIAIVGRAPGIYNLHLGAGHAGQRLNKLYKEALNEEQILEALDPIFGHYAKDKLPGEWFGDFCIRKNYVRAVINGPDFHL